MQLSLVRNPSETDPLMTQSQRKEFPAGMEREVVDGGVREGRPETAHLIGLPWLLFFVIVLLAVLGLALNWHTFFP